MIINSVGFHNMSYWKCLWHGRMVKGLFLIYRTGPSLCSTIVRDPLEPTRDHRNIYSRAVTGILSTFWYTFFPLKTSSFWVVNKRSFYPFTSINTSEEQYTKYHRLQGELSCCNPYKSSSLVLDCNGVQLKNNTILYRTLNGNVEFTYQITVTYVIITTRW